MIVRWSVESFKTQFNCFLSISSTAAVGQNLTGLASEILQNTVSWGSVPDQTQILDMEEV